jgi:hypothetical protein
MTSRSPQPFELRLKIITYECEQCHSEAERLGGLEIDDRLTASGPLHRQVGGFLPFEMRPA